MTPTRTIALLTTFCSTLGLAAACSSSSAPHATTDVTSEGGFPAAQDASFDGGALVVDSSSDAGGDSGALGPVGVVSQAVPPCQPFGGVTTELVQADGGSSLVGYSRMGKAGTHRYIADFDDALLGFFDLPSGVITSTSSLTGNRFDVASEGASVGSLWTSSAGTFYTRYLPDGSSSAATAVSVTKNADALAIASNGTSSFVIWAAVVNQRLSAAPVTSAGVVGASSGFGVGTFHSHVSLAATSTATGYAAIWAGDATASAPKSTTLTFGTFSTAGALQGSAKTVLTTSRQLTVTRLLSTAGGLVVLLNGTEDGTTITLGLQADGTPAAIAHQFTGAVTGWDLALSGSSLGLVASAFSNDDAGGRPGTPLFLPLSSTGDPAGDWICLGPSDAYATDNFDVALDGDGNGNFAAALAKVPQRAKVMQFDQTGKKLPQ